MTNFDFSVSRFPHLWDDTFYVISELRELLTGNRSENCSNIKRIWACSYLDLSLKINQYRGDKKNCLIFGFFKLFLNRGFNFFLVSLNARLLTLTLVKSNNLKNMVCDRINFLGYLYLSCPRVTIKYINLLIGPYYTYPYYFIAMPVR